jgi:SAM-dependent methyltransferase
VDTEFPCPVCSGTQWREHEKFVYALSDHERPHYSSLQAMGRLAGRFAELIAFGRRRRTILRNFNLSRYHRLRRRVLFERWFPGAREITLTSIYCECCGFMSYRPRPQRADLVAKYRFLGAEDRPHPQFASAAALKLDRRRADWVWSALQPFLPRRPQLKVLDYGGGDGKLMQPFLEQGHECCLLDYSEQQIPGVARVGAELDDLAPQLVFDVIIASHVLEHVPRPREDLGKLREHLAADGVIYCEVPSEILGGLWIDNDPVTHINFFTLQSFRRLLQEATLGLVRSGQRVGNYGRSYRDTLWAVANRTPATAQPVGDSDVSSYLYPRRSATVRLLAELLWKTAVARLIR